MYQAHRRAIVGASTRRGWVALDEGSECTSHLRSGEVEPVWFLTLVLRVMISGGNKISLAGIDTERNRTFGRNGGFFVFRRVIRSDLARHQSG